MILVESVYKLKKDEDISWKFSLNSCNFLCFFKKIFFLCVCFIFIFCGFLQIKKHKFSYFKGFWNILDMLVIFISTLCIAFNVYRTIAVSEKLKSLLAKGDIYAQFEFLAFCQVQFNNAIAITVFLAWIKVFFFFFQ